MANKCSGRRPSGVRTKASSECHASWEKEKDVGIGMMGMCHGREGSMDGVGPWERNMLEQILVESGCWVGWAWVVEIVGVRGAQWKRLVVVGIIYRRGGYIGVSGVRVAVDLKGVVCGIARQVWCPPARVNS